MSDLSSRSALRHHFRNLRRSLTPEQQNAAAHNVLASCLDYPAFLQARTLAFYLANDGELSTQYLLDYCWHQNKTVLLPVIDPVQTTSLVFVKYEADSPLILNKYGIAEPQYHPDKAIPLQSIDIIFTPLVAFDKTGNRLGMGGGYYDRTLAQLNSPTFSTKIIGLAHDLQQSDNIPSQSWDIPLHGIVTPSQIFMLNRSV